MDRTRILLAAVAVPLLIAQAACQKSAPPAPAAPAKPPAQVDAARLTNAAADAANWMSVGRTYDEQRHSPLKQIDTTNVAQLGLTWHYDLDAIARGQEATPVVVDGVMYVTSTWSKVFALDAKTGKPLWTYDPQVPGEWGINACCDVVNRGVAVWGGKVFVGTLDGRLVALDAATGKPVWETQTTDRTKRFSITGAPRIIKGKVIIGNGGAEFGVRGYVAAYDVDTGKQLWRFYTVPGNPKDGFENKAMEMAAKTWKGKWWELGGGGTVWDAMAYDPELDLLYIGTGNGTPWNRKLRSPGGGSGPDNDNLFLSSIIALKPDTGEYVWHHQQVPGDDWDYDATQQMILADLSIDGKPRKVLMQAPKSGIFTVLDRATGEFISGKPFVNVNWLTGMDPKTGRAHVAPAARYSETGKAFTATPGAAGGHAWHPMSFSPETGLVYIPAHDLTMGFVPEVGRKTSQYAFNIGYDFAATSMPRDMKIIAGAQAGARSHLAAWDPVQQKEVWRVQQNTAGTAGVVSTAGNLVFQGTVTGELVAYQADTGAKLWSAPTQTPVIAAPISYEVDGQQYVAVEVGWGGAVAIAPGIVVKGQHAPTNTPRILVFALNGKDSLPPVQVPEQTLSPPANTASAEVVAKGMKIYHPYCSNCHGDAGVSGSFIPDLRYTPALSDANVWAGIVLGGERKSRGMVSFANELNKDDAEAVRAYVISVANWYAEEAKKAAAAAPAAAPAATTGGGT